MYSVYNAIDERTNNVFYVGATKDFQHRISQHMRTGSLVGDYVADMLSVGVMPVFNVLEELDMHSHAGIRERYWIKFFRSMGMHLINVSSGGYNINGGRRSTSEEFQSELQSWIDTGVCHWKHVRQMRWYVKSKYGIVVP